MRGLVIIFHLQGYLDEGIKKEDIGRCWSKHRLHGKCIKYFPQKLKQEDNTRSTNVDVMIILRCIFEK